MPKIVSVETLKKQENDFITRVVLANLVFVFRIQSRDQPALTCTPRLRFSRMRRRKSPLLCSRRNFRSSGDPGGAMLLQLPHEALSNYLVLDH
jgi:hypothetical protein